MTQNNTLPEVQNQTTKRKPRFYMRLKTIFTIFLCYLSSFVVFAEPYQDPWGNANALYEQKQYKQAAILYEDLVKAGKGTAALYRNLGSAYYRLDSIALAILWFERALRLEPRNAETQQNLLLANKRIPNAIPAYPPFVLVQWWTQATNLLSADAWAWLVLFCWWATAVLIILFLRSEEAGIKKRLFAGAGLFFAFTFVGVLLGGSKYRAETRQDEGILMPPLSALREGASDNAASVEEAPAGTRVLILEKSGEWARLRLPDGQEGWTKATHIENITLY